MTKRDYERAAKVAQGYNAPGWGDIGDPAHHGAVVEAFVRLFHEDGNPRFDVARFRAACQPGANVRARPRKVAA
jgi:hypothetical protein